MRKIIMREFSLDLPQERSAFLWGPRKVGKTYWIRHNLPGATVIDLLRTDTYAEYAARPALLRERFRAHKGLVVIDEVQKIPALLDEVHWLIENAHAQFLLTGSSARKLRRGHANLLGGRAWRRTMTPLTFHEVEGFELESVMYSGLLPPHYLSPDPIEDLRAYTSDYLREEIASEALAQDIPSFAAFLRVAALTSSELLNYTNVGREAGISSKTVRMYFDILEDTYLGFRLPPWKKSQNRRLIQTEKFYIFDVGVTNHLARRTPKIGSPDFGKSFEHFILMELAAYRAYRAPDLPLSFFRTASGYEVDFILGEKDAAIEVKGSARVHDGDLRSIRALADDGPVKHRIIVCLEKEPRTLDDGIRVLPWQMFLEELWAGHLVP